MLRKTTLAITFYIATAINMLAQDYAVTRRVSSADGMSNDFVTELAIDGQGYVWTATEAGVNRISGNTCQTFMVTEWPPKDNFLTMTNNLRLLPGQENKNIFGMKITALRWHKPTNQMLIGTEVGLVVYDCKKGTVRYVSFNDGIIRSSIEDIALAANGVWLVYGNGKVQRLDCSKLTLSNVNIKQNITANCGIDCGNGMLILGHNKRGISLVNTKNGQVRRFMHKDGDPLTLPGNNVRKIMKDSSGRIWVGTDHGVALFNISKGTFAKVQIGTGGYDANVYDIYQMRDGMLWVANDMGGILVMDPEQDPEKGVMRYNNTQVILSSINARALLQDEYGNVWVGNHSTGVDFISAGKPEFNIYDFLNSATSTSPSNQHIVYSIAPAKGGGLWLAGDTELVLWRDGEIRQRWSNASYTQRRFAFPRCIMSDSKGRVWIGIDDNGVSCFTQATGSFKSIDIGHSDCDIHSFAEDSEGRIWIGSEFGVCSYTDDGGVRDEKIVNKVTRNGIVTSFLWLRDNTVFVSTHGVGAYVINLRTGACTSLRMKDGLPSDRVSSAISDGKGGLWLATHEGLVHVDDAMTLKGLTIYNKTNGLADNHTSSVMMDAIGRVWVSTYSGVSCLDSSTGRIYNYDHKDTGQPCAFITRPTMCDDGCYYFCTASGVMCFNPLTLTGNQKASQVQIISCEAYAPDGTDTRILLLSPDEDGRAVTSYQQNTLRLTFCVRNFAQTQHVEYSYMMKGMDDKWYYIGSDNDVVFRGLQPGNYTFVLRAKLKSQDWKDASEVSMEIRITPPFWQTWWAYMLYGIALIVAVVLFVHSYKRRLALKNTLELEKRQNQQRQELNEERLHFFTNITHELRTPLTLILGPLEDAMAEVAQKPLRRRMEMIQKNAERLRDLINEILEFRKTETQNRRLTVARGDIGMFINEICLNFKELYNNPKVSFTYSIAPDLPKVYFDSEVITTILNNFLSNAIKYTEKGSIDTTVRLNGDRIDITVSDTGHGISEDALPHIFDRYYQADGKHQASGTGIGLALVKALADLHKAKLSVDSKEGRGSMFTFSLSIADTYPEALHKEDAETEEKPVADVSTVQADEEEVTENQLTSMLIVEDNADIREYIADSFGEDFRILQAENGEEGLRVATENIPDIIVSDIMMPKMNGIELTKRLKEDIRTSHIPIILLTAKDTDDDKEEGYDSGADSYLTKPFTTKLLASRIHNLLQARRRMAEQILQSRPAVAAADDDVKPETDDTATEKEWGGASLSRLDREFLDKLNAIISENIIKEDLDLPFVTDKMAMSHSTFYRKVKALTGMTAKEYIRKFRLRHCYRLLESGDYNVTEAAIMTGFNQMAHFREVFKKEFGILPSEVKKKQAE